MLYEKKNDKTLKNELFESPSSEYRSMPFWAWNCKLDENQLCRQIPIFTKMGMGGFHIHCRVGLDTEYLSKEFFKCVHACEDEAKKDGLYCCLYDEDRWPSGSAGGFVTKNHKFRNRFLVFSPSSFQEKSQKGYMAAAKAVRSDERTLLAKYKVILDEEGYLTSYERMPDDAQGENVWEAILEVSGDTPWFNNQAYVNTLDPKAIAEFIRLTHETYNRELGSEFGGNIRTMFTDEPQMTLKEVLPDPHAKIQVIAPYTNDFDQTFTAKYGYSLLDHLPAVYWEKRDKKDYHVRYDYHVHVMERFADAFGDQIGQWCDRHGLSLTGHMLNEWTLYSQTLGVGECMRTMKCFGIPGVDMLCDSREYSTVKQAQSVAHQCAREGVMSELYGVTGWGFDFRNHKLAGDWQAALGVTLRVPHLAWVSMQGEAKRDYPASIGYQSPWYERYDLIENHFARLNTALTRGRTLVRVGVIHPIESYWMHWGNQMQTAVDRQVLETNFSNLIEWLLFGLIDFDFISESMLAEDTSTVKEAVFPIGSMEYEVVIVPECHTIRSTTLAKLEAFQRCGGKVIFMGEKPGYVDAKINERAAQLAKKCLQIPFNRASLLQNLEDVRDIDIFFAYLEGEDPTRMKHMETGRRASNLFYQMRQDGDQKWLFICHVKKPQNEAVANIEQWDIRVRGEYKPVLYDTMSGEIYPIGASYENNVTCIRHASSFHGSLLLRLTPGRSTLPNREFHVQDYVKHLLPEPKSYSIEDNCLVLDQAEYAFDDEPYCSREELLRIDNLYREKLGYPLRMEALAQPWTQKEEADKKHVLKLRFLIHSETETDRVSLAFENASDAILVWNGQEIVPDITQWYVDETIKKTVLGKLNRGTNILEVMIPFGRKTNIEWMYLLGPFGVRVAGRESVVTDRPGQLNYGDVCGQGLPFYSANLEYHTEIDVQKGRLFLEIPHYVGALLSISVDDEEAGTLFMAPYRVDCGEVTQGKHRVTIRCYGNRANTFGPLHNADSTERWYGPNIWRTQGTKWSYEYQLTQFGVLTCPLYWVES